MSLVRFQRLTFCFYEDIPSFFAAASVFTVNIWLIVWLCIVFILVCVYIGKYLSLCMSQTFVYSAVCRLLAIVFVHLIFTEVPLIFKIYFL